MSDVPQIPTVPKPPVDPVARSIAKPDAFSKPASFTGKDKAKSAPSKNTRIRTMDWKRGKGRPRKMPRDPRDVKFF